MSCREISLVITMTAIYIAMVIATLLVDTEFVYRFLPLILALTSVYAMDFGAFATKHEDMRFVKNIKRVARLMLSITFLTYIIAVAEHGDMYTVMIKTTFLIAYASIVIMWTATSIAKLKLNEKGVIR